MHIKKSPQFKIKYTYAYTIFGKLLRGNYEEVEFLYNGKYGVTSDANGLYYMRARYYNIDIMRFINQDILKGSIDSSQSLNRYAYVEGNPVNFLDPFGLCKDNVDTSTAHDVLTVLGAIAFVVGATAAAVVVASALIAGTFFSGVNAGLYMYDAMEADTKEERDTAIANSAFSLVTIGTGVVSNTGKIVISINAKVASMDQAYYALKKVLDLLANYLSLEGVE